jgi:hypothetical protein
MDGACGIYGTGEAHTKFWYENLWHIYMGQERPILSFGMKICGIYMGQERPILSFGMKVCGMYMGQERPILSFGRKS